MPKTFTSIVFLLDCTYAACCYFLSVAVGFCSHSCIVHWSSTDCFVKASAHMRVVGIQWNLSPETTSWMARTLTSERLSLKLGESLTTTSYKLLASVAARLCSCAPTRRAGASS